MDMTKLVFKDGHGLAECVKMNMTSQMFKDGHDQPSD
jgi:hypothetical protein